MLNNVGERTSNLWNASFKLTLSGCVVSIYCVVFESLDEVCNEVVPGTFVCSSFLISVFMFIVSKALLISSATVIVRAGGAIWLNPFSTVLFSVCSAVTVECCVLYPCCMGGFVNCLVKQFAICLGVFVILLLNVMELLEVLYWIDHVWSSIECVCCGCVPSERLDAPSINYVCVFVCRKLSPHLGV